MISVRNILVEQTERTRHSSKADIHRFIEESELKIASLESQISPLRDREHSCVDAPQRITSHIHSLVELRDHERSCVDALRHIISPIRTLPVELLAEIFRLTLDDPKTHIAEAYRISQICSDWRNVACGNPQLWTGPICVDLGSEKIFGREDLYADGLEAWLARSAPLSVPVSLQLELDRTNSDPRILEIVLRVAPRFRSLRCRGVPLSFISRLAECKLDSLEELDLGFVESDSNAAEFPALTMVPRLRKSSIIIEASRPHALIPWAQLTDLTLHCDSIDVILDILVQCANLTSTALYTSEWYVYPATAQFTRPPLPLNHLHTLTVGFGRSKHMARFLGTVSAPALEALNLNFFGTGMHSVAPLTAFLMQSPTIARLEIYGDYAPTSHELIEVLRHTVHLTHLKLTQFHKHSFDDALLNALSCKDGVAPLVPKLHSLAMYRIMQKGGFTMEALEHMLVSRWRADPETSSGLHAVARWSHVELCWSLRGPFFDNLQRQGLPIELMY
ncbi:Origin recognition complex subunit 1 [Mycena sanguinolenta]|uniref:Origin recognition complex subunit 1 n=1 Tax=Mycena sanguinolenta TaxID=230812 RepID=A0A8H6YSH8_9AGAR|nr:Origin recognition complex subunit 1 [Mycena sanguinolenta]